MSVRITEDEVDKRMRQLRDERRAGRTDRDVTSVDLPAGVHAKWVNRRSRDGARVQHFKNHGYEIAKAGKDGKGITTTAGNITPEGNIINGDQILMVTTKDNVIDRLAKAKLRGIQSEQAFKETRQEEINKLARDAGIRRPVAFDDSKQGEERIARRAAKVDNDDD